MNADDRRAESQDAPISPTNVPISWYFGGIPRDWFAFELALRWDPKRFGIDRRTASGGRFADGRFGGVQPKGSPWVSDAAACRAGRGAAHRSTFLDMSPAVASAVAMTSHDAGATMTNTAVFGLGAATATAP